MKRRPPKRRVLTISHGHPAFTRGGAEIAAYALHQHIQADASHESWFLGCRTAAPTARLGVPITQPLGEHEFLYDPGPFDWFNFANRDPAFPAAFTALLQELRPDILHFHHFAHLGIEGPLLARATLPNARILLTLHEYLLICHAHGQMLTRPDEALCNRATPDACHACFPDRSRSDFFLRTAYLKRCLQPVDHFSAPSAFLAARMRDWGIPPERLHVIPNLVAPPTQSPIPPVPQPGAPLRIGFFGQISRLKGSSVLIDAAALLQECNITIDIHGTDAAQPPPLQAEFRAKLATAGPNLRHRGAYRPDDVDRLMQAVDLVVVPSIWWENAPVVIQEAFRNHRPVVCSDLGGMREAVGAGGWRFPANDPVSLAALLRRLEQDRPAVAAMAACTRMAATPDQVFRAHRALYQA